MHPLRLIASQIDKDISSYQSVLGLFSQLDNIYAQIQQEIEGLEVDWERAVLTDLAGNYYRHGVEAVFKRYRLVEELNTRQAVTIGYLN